MWWVCLICFLLLCAGGWMIGVMVSIARFIAFSRGRT